MKKRPRHLFETTGWNIKEEQEQKQQQQQQQQTTNQLNQNKIKNKIKIKNKNKTNTNTNNNNNTKLKSNQTTDKNHSILAHSLLSTSSLTGSRFRILNETLYTSTGGEAFKLFQLDSNSSQSNLNHHQDFNIYHLGFNQQLKQWPSNPINIIANQLITQLDLQIKSNHQSPLTLIADLGCGQATLAKLLTKSNSSLFKVFSFDLVQDPLGWITVAECSTRVPLPGSIDDQIENALMDVVVCCLSLMSTDWIGMILEARRILKINGELRIAEVTSRFIDVDQFIKFITSIGFSYLNIDKSNSHFILFTFKKKKLSSSSCSSSDSSHNLYSDSKQDLIQLGQKYLKPCIYKRR